MPIYSVGPRKIVKGINCTVACVVILSQKMEEKKARELCLVQKLGENWSYLSFSPFHCTKEKVVGYRTPK